MIPWDAALCSLTEIYRRLRVHLQVRRTNIACRFACLTLWPWRWGHTFLPNFCSEYSRPTLNISLFRLLLLVHYLAYFLTLNYALVSMCSTFNFWSRQLIFTKSNMNIIMLEVTLASQAYFWLPATSKNKMAA